MNYNFNISEDDFRNILNENNRPLNDTNGDHALKDIGDRVMIFDYSSLTHGDGQELKSPDYDDISDRDYYVVIAVNQQNVFDSYFVLYTQDLIVAHPKSKKQYRVNSKHVKLYLKNMYKVKLLNDNMLKNVTSSD